MDHHRSPFEHDVDHDRSVVRDSLERSAQVVTREPQATHEITERYEVRTARERAEKIAKAFS